MRSIELRVSKRESDRSVSAVRRSGGIPAVYYGVGGPNISVEIDAREFDRSGMGTHGAHLIRFVSDESSLDKGISLLKEVQTHPVSGRVMHVDFMRIDLSEPISANIALHFVGKAVGVVNGGILQPIRRELEVRALPTALPEVIEVDVTELDIGESVHVEDLTVAEGVEISYTENFTVVTVVPPLVEAVEAEEVEEVEGAPAAAEEEGEGVATGSEEGSS
ncbi:MAG: 50S ribosomal protein L25 [Candidatus Binatia bacterium]